MSEAAEKAAAPKPVAEMTVDECWHWCMAAPDRDEAHRRRETFFLHHLAARGGDEKVRREIAKLQKQIRDLAAKLGPARAEHTRLSFADMEIHEAIEAQFSPAKAA